MYLCLPMVVFLYNITLKQQSLMAWEEEGSNPGV